MNENIDINLLKNRLKGDIYSDNLHRMIYATDASVYKEMPFAVAYPADKNDLKLLLDFCAENDIPMIPRAAGTSLAGQVVGKGIVVDISRHFTRVLELNVEEATVLVEPGVIRDELNASIRGEGLFFGPNTSTSNRCMLGGMTGNNSSGSTSIKYGVTRDKVLEVNILLSSGKEVVFKALDQVELEAKLTLDDQEGEIYRFFYNTLRDEEVRDRIHREFPKKEIHRRNTGYAIDGIANMQPFEKTGEPFNLAKLICGSEGTLGLITAIKLQLDPLPPAHSLMFAAHFKSIEQACKAVVPLMKHPLYSCEMMDKVILDCTLNNKSQAPNRFFIQDDPKAILLLELCADSEEALLKAVEGMRDCLKEETEAYAYPELRGEDIEKAFELRKAGLGLLGNIVGDNKAVACIEDTAVSIDDLSAYITEFEALMKDFGQEAVYYAHAGAGELHLRPILNLKKAEGVAQFRAITEAVARLVKKYGGAMSGEHGEGRVRSEFIKMMIGEENYRILEELKMVFDAKHIFNPGKIVDPVAMDEHLRYVPDRKEPEITTFMDFSDSQGFLRAVEKCNGSGDCRKTEQSKGTMCPSYHATKDEKDTTRARANALREVLTTIGDNTAFNSPDLKEVLDLCLSCKACGSECPSNIDMASFKAEFLYQYHKENGSSLRDKLFAYNGKLSKFLWPMGILINNKASQTLLSRVMGIAPERKLPEIRRVDLERFLRTKADPDKQYRECVLYIDEFSQFYDSDISKDAIEVLLALGYHPELVYGDSGRSYISKGFLEQAKKCCDKLTHSLLPFASQGLPIIGLEPSAILGFRDDYLRLASDKQAAEKVGRQCVTIEEFIAELRSSGKIDREIFTTDPGEVRYHAHCHQKSLSDVQSTFTMLSIPENYRVRMINSGCCGMAGAFGYEKEHYEISMAIGEQRLFKAIRKAEARTIIAANGNSCRHQISDGTGVRAFHPVSVLKRALR